MALIARWASRSSRTSSSVLARPRQADTRLLKGALIAAHHRGPALCCTATPRAELCALRRHAPGICERAVPASHSLGKRLEMRTLCREAAGHLHSSRTTARAPLRRQSCTASVPVSATRTAGVRVLGPRRNCPAVEGARVGCVASILGEPSSRRTAVHGRWRSGKNVEARRRSSVWLQGGAARCAAALLRARDQPPHSPPRALPAVLSTVAAPFVCSKPSLPVSGPLRQLELAMCSPKPVRTGTPPVALTEQAREPVERWSEFKLRGATWHAITPSASCVAPGIMQRPRQRPSHISVEHPAFLVLTRES
eukprot:211075-Rhodomonas_salina.2